MSKSIQLKDNKNEKMYPHPYYPVGSIYLSVNNTNPSKWFGGTWEQIAKGRTLVGVDTGDADFNTVKKTGGKKTHTLTVNEIPSHNHTQKGELRYGNTNWWIGGTGGTTIEVGDYATTNTGGSQPHNNLQPYFTCYIWCRTA